MGGCKCSYKSCSKTSDGVTHFFHFPVKNYQRCASWIKSCNRPDYAQLTMAQLKNKVVCQFHFVDKMFVNYKHNRLTYKAVPTIELYGSDEQHLKPHDPPNESSKASSLSNDIMDILEIKYSAERGISIPPIACVANSGRNSDVNAKKPYIQIIQKHHSTPLLENSINLKDFSVSSIKNLSTTDNTVLDPDTTQDEINSTVVEQTQKKNTTNVMENIVLKHEILDLPMEVDCTVQKDNQTEPAAPLYEPPQTTPSNQPAKNVIIQNVVTLPPKEMIKYINSKVKNSSMSTRPVLTKVIKTKTSTPITLSKTFVRKVINNIEKPSTNETEVKIHQTPMKNLKNVKIIDEHLRRFNRDRLMKNRFASYDTTKLSNQKNDSKQISDYMRLILKTRDEMSEIKKMIEKNSQQQKALVVEETSIPKLSKEVLFAAIVSYLTPELAKQVHCQMFPSLVINGSF